MIDIQLLRMMRTRTDYNKIIGAINTDALEQHTRAMVRAITRYYKKYPSHGNIDFTVFAPFIERNVYPDLIHEDKLVYRNIIKNMSKNYPDEDTRAGIIESIHELNLVHTARAISERYHDGEDIDPVQEMQYAMDRYSTAVGVLAMPEVGENIDDLLDGMENEDGIKWRLKCLNDAMRPLHGGDFGILAARPDQGKTSLLASEITYMAPQLPADRPVLWLNNEGPGYVIRPRLMQAALNCNTDQIVKKKQAGTLYDDYYEAVGGKNRIRIMDIHGYNSGQVESIIAAVSPGLIVYDMIDNIQGFGEAARTDLQLEKMYQWAREKAVKYDAIAFATSQISADGADKQYPGMSLLKDSKTGKQGACDFQLMVGSMESDSQYANVRWLSLPKNKLRKLKSTRLETQVMFDRDKARYRDIEVNYEDTEEDNG